MKKISIIIPNFNSNNYNKKCISSLYDQSYRNIEIIIVTNLSSDNIKTEYEELLKGESKIKIVKSKNNNITNNIIKGIEASTGDYISFVNSNDYLDLDYFRLLVDNITNNNCDIVISNFVKDMGEKKVAYSLSFNTNNDIYDGKDFFSMYIRQTGRSNRYNMIWNKLIKKEICNKLIKEHISLKDTPELDEDIIIATFLYKYANKTSFCDEAIYHINDINETIQNFDNEIKIINNSFNYVINFFKSEKIISKYKKDIEIWNSFCVSKYILD